MVRVAVGPSAAAAVPPDTILIEIPPPTVWGPLIWKILHISAEHSGNSVTDQTTWKNILDSLKYVIPCDECKSHFTNYLNTTGFRPPAPKTPAFRGYVKRWVWTFHNVVNGRLGKSAFQYEQLEPTYSTLDVGDYINAFAEFMGVFKAAGLTNDANWNVFKYNIMKTNA